MLEEITEASTRPNSDVDSQSESRGQSPSGEGRRLGGSSRNGSSSALTGVGAAHQSGDGGLPTGTQTKSGDDDWPPGYTNVPSFGEQSLDRATQSEGMNFEDEEIGGGTQPSPFRPQDDTPSWSFSRATDAHGPSQMTTVPTDDEDLLDDDASNRAVDDGDVSDPDLRMASLMDSPRGAAYPGTPMEETSFPDISAFAADGDDDEEDELPVVELQVHDEDQTLP